MSISLLFGLLTFTACSELDPKDTFTGVYFVKLESEPAEVVGIVSEISDNFDSSLFDVLNTYDSVTEGFSVRLPHTLVGEVERLDFVSEVVPDENKNYAEPNKSESQYDYSDGEITAGIARIGGPYLGSVDLSTIHVAVLDTGIDGAHPDLNVVNAIDLAGPSSGDYADGTDPNGHGTHIAGTIGAISGNDLGVAGVAPSVPLHNIRVLDSEGGGYYTDILAGLEYVLDNPEIRVVNLSLGGPMDSATDPLRDAIVRLTDAGVVVVIAAGNEFQDTANTSPAGYDVGIVVSAYDTDGNTDNGFADFSNFGSEVDIAAPGVSIYSTYPGGSYEYLDGTSMATPHVAGAAAIYLANNPNANADDVKDALVNGGESGYQGQGGDHPEPLLQIVE